MISIIATCWLIVLWYSAAKTQLTQDDSDDDVQCLQILTAGHVSIWQTQGGDYIWNVSQLWTIDAFPCIHTCNTQFVSIWAVKYVW